MSDSTSQFSYLLGKFLDKHFTPLEKVEVFDELAPILKAFIEESLNASDYVKKPSTNVDLKQILEGSLKI